MLLVMCIRPCQHQLECGSLAKIHSRGLEPASVVLGTPLCEARGGSSFACTGFLGARTGPYLSASGAGCHDELPLLTSPRGDADGGKVVKGGSRVQLDRLARGIHSTGRTGYICNLKVLGTRPEPYPRPVSS